MLRPKSNGDALLGRPLIIHYKVNGQVTQQDVWDSGSGPAQEEDINPQPNITQISDEEPDMRIKLSSFDGDTPEITASTDFKVFSNGDKVAEVDSGDIASIYLDGDKFKLNADGDTYTVEQPVRFVPSSDGIIEIANFDHSPAWNEDLNDNKYRGILEIREEDGELIVINELRMEHYLRGLGEVSNNEEPEKIKAIIVAARTYAMYYTENDKFPGKPYHLDDDPNVSQKYLGYGLEIRSPNVGQGVIQTMGEVVTYNGTLIKTPYFNQSDGVATKSAQEVWGWTDTPYLVSVDDSYCDGDQFFGHGIEVTDLY